ncbi:hypothetical protein B0H16DRAFT_1474803 [Mycena metata]|uniref:Uncharacterized protein n=1 Tax=Mycena metata TaxID=1033252 RepID=A0AAD7MJJ3_9AGAR|nr:hypothetical protein B0H16DRAFT_1474803 [Mycena metata]
MATTITSGFSCEYCAAKLSSDQGLRSHIHQSQACMARHNARYADSDSESSGDDAPAAPLRDSNTGDSLRESWDGDARVDSDLERDVDNFGADPPSDDEVPPIRDPEPPSASKRCRATMEEVEDEDERWVQDFPQEFEAGAVLEEYKTEFGKLRQKQKAAGEEPWSPFKSEEEWEMACKIILPPK